MYKGKDMITQARTGTGKTLSFVLPLVSRMLKDGVPQERGRLATVSTNIVLWLVHILYYGKYTFLLC